MTMHFYTQTNFIILDGSSPQLAPMMTLGWAWSILVANSLGAKPEKFREMKI